MDSDAYSYMGICLQRRHLITGLNICAQQVLSFPFFILVVNFGRDMLMYSFVSSDVWNHRRKGNTQNAKWNMVQIDWTSATPGVTTRKYQDENLVLPIFQGENIFVSTLKCDGQERKLERNILVLSFLLPIFQSKLRNSSSMSGNPEEISKAVRFSGD